MGTATAGRFATWWANTSRGLPQPFWYLLAGTFVNRMGQMVTPFLALYLSGPRDFSPSVVGVVLACLGAGAFASQPLGGYRASGPCVRAGLLGHQPGRGRRRCDRWAAGRALVLAPVRPRRGDVPCLRGADRSEGARDSATPQPVTRGRLYASAWRSAAARPQREHLPRRNRVHAEP